MTNEATLTEPARAESAMGLAEAVLPVLAEHAAAADETAAFPVESVAALRASGLLGLLVPQAHGGLSGGPADLAEVAQVLAGGCLSTAMIWAMHCQQVDALVRFAPPGLSGRLLPRIAAGELLLASITTEPTGGGVLTSASSPLGEAGERLRLDRLAPIVTGGEHADGFLVTMRDSAGATDNRVTLVYADREQVGIETTSGWNPMGMRGTHSVGMAVRGDLPVEQVVGQRGAYREIAVDSMIPLAHIGWSACWLGAARSALSEVVALSRSRRRPSSLDPGSELFTERLARARIDLELVSAYLDKVVTEVGVLRAAGRSLDNPATQIHLNSLKVAAAELTFSAVDRLVQLTGLATGYLRGSAIPLERHFRDLRSASLNFANDRLLKAIGSLSVLDRSVRLV